MQMKKFLGSLAVASLIAGPAFAADMATRAPAYTKAPLPVPQFSWTGCYIGATAGGDFGHSNYTWNPNPAGFPVSGPDLTTAGAGSASSSGFTGGGELGCNYQTGMFVWGGEADFEYTGINISRNAVSPAFGVPVTESTTSHWLSTYRGRLGIANGPWLFYATGGLAVGQFNTLDTATFAASATNNTVSTSGTKTGWTAGGGIEWMFVPGWSVKAEYLHVDLGSVSATSANSNPVAFPFSTILHTHTLTEEIGRVGVNFHF
jgi:outer membrane immunogenic protein